MDSFSVLEAVLYSRSYDQASSFRQHNHILHGPYLRYIVHPLRPKDAGLFRLALVQGKRRGRMSGIRLHASSEVSAVSVAMEGTDFPTRFLINVSGVDPSGNEAKWQLSMPSEDLQLKWQDALKKAREFGETKEELQEADLLRDLAKQMKDGVRVKNRLHLFKICPRSFVGRHAVRWLMREKSCTHSQAVALGNKMMSYGLLHHVTHEHFFCEQRLLYRFSPDIDPPIAESAMGTDDVFLRGEAPNDTSKLVEALRKSVRETKETRNALSTLQIKYDHVSGLWAKRSLQLEETQRTLAMVDISLIGIQLVGLVIFAAMLYWPGTRSMIAGGIAGVTVIVFLNFGLGRGIAYLFNCQTEHVSMEPERSNPMIASSQDLYDVDDDAVAFGDGNVSGAEDDEEYDEDEYDGDPDDDDEPEAPQRGRSSSVAAPGGSPSISSRKRDIRSPARSPDGGATKVSTIQSLRKMHWPNNPILVRRSPLMLCRDTDESRRQALTQPLSLHQQRPQNSVFDLESDLFVGKAYMIVADLADSPAAFFRGKRRKFHVVVQGQFKQALPFSSVYTGQVFSGPLEQKVAQWSIVRSSLHLLSKLQPANRVCLSGAKPYVLSPLASTAQTIVMSRPGQEPVLHVRGEPVLQEDMRMMGKKFDQLSSKRRKSFFSKRSNLISHSFEPDLVYTFDFYQHMLNLATFQVDLGFMKYDVVRGIGPRPIQVMALAWDPLTAGETRPSEWPFLYNIEIWHRKTLDQEFSLAEHAESSSKKTVGFR